MTNLRESCPITVEVPAALPDHLYIDSTTLTT